MTPMQAGMLLFKLAVTLGLLWFVIGKIELAPVLTHMRSVRTPWALLAISLLASSLLCTAIRWFLVSSMVAVPMRIGRAVRLGFIGHFFSQMLPSSIGGDAVRVWMVSRDGVALARAFISVVCDRGLAMVVLIVIVAASLTAGSVFYPLVLPPLGATHVVLMMCVAVGLLLLYVQGERIGAALQRFRFTRGLGEITHDIRTVLFSGSRSLAALALSSLAQALLVLAIYAFAQSFAADLRLGDAFIVVPTIALLSSLPISFAGWGVRETMMVIGLGFIGVPAVDALAISVSYGLGQLVVGLPGGILWLAGRRERQALKSMRQPLSASSVVSKDST